MLFSGISRLGKSFIRILKTSRSNKNKKRKQKSNQTQFRETRNRKFTRSRYAKLIPSENFTEEKHRSNLHYVTEFEQNQEFSDSSKENSSKVFRTHHKHKCIIRSVTRALKYETKSEKHSFLRNVEQLIKNLKAVTEISDDEDLLAMYTTMNDIYKEHQRNWLHKTIPRKERNQPRKVYSKKAGGDFTTADWQSTGKLPEESTSYSTCNTVPDFEKSLPGQTHSCDVQECLVNSTPRKAGKKSQTLCITRTMTPNKLDEFGGACMKQYSLNNLNFSYGGLKDNFVQIEASRLNQANVAHCRAVAKIVDDRLKRRRPLNQHMVCMYADLQDGSNNILSKLKHDMLNTCLNTYFFPRQNSVNISWTDKVDTLLSCSTNSDYLTDIFERRYELVKCCFKAVMVMSGTAADLLRHKQLAMLDTVAVVLGIPRKSLLIVHKWEVPQLFY